MRDDAPWLYELGMEVYRALCSGNAKNLDDARCEFQQMARAMRHGHPMLIGTGQFANTVTGAELRYIQSNWATFQSNVTFIGCGVPW